MFIRLIVPFLCLSASIILGVTPKILRKNKSAPITSIEDSKLLPDATPEAHDTPKLFINTKEEDTSAILNGDQDTVTQALQRDATVNNEESTSELLESKYQKSIKKVAQLLYQDRYSPTKLDNGNEVGSFFFVTLDKSENTIVLAGNRTILLYSGKKGERKGTLHVDFPISKKPSFITDKVLKIGYCPPNYRVAHKQGDPSSNYYYLNIHTHSIADDFAEILSSPSDSSESENSSSEEENGNDQGNILSSPLTMLVGLDYIRTQQYDEMYSDPKLIGQQLLVGQKRAIVVVNEPTLELLLYDKTLYNQTKEIITAHIQQPASPLRQVFDAWLEKKPYPLEQLEKSNDETIEVLLPILKELNPSPE